MSAKVVGWVAQEIGEDAVPEPWFTPDADRAQRLECTGRFAVEPLILQSDHLAELEAVREEALREVEELLCRNIDLGDGWTTTVLGKVRALLPAPPTPDEQEGL